jgi:hypothetical protein
MCIILGEVHSVTKTNLFVLANKDKTRQMTFYSNTVSTPKTNMMILPVPNSSSTPEKSIELHTIRYKNLFADLKKSVKSINSLSNYSHTTRSLACSAALPRDTLEIISHGSYLVSIAPTIEDLLRLDMKVFALTPELYTFFGKHYTREFSYICCVLKEGLESYEPLCYSHPLHSSGKLFVPTLHYHNHGGKAEVQSADWDHKIYSVGTVEKANLGYTSNYSNEVLWGALPTEFHKLKVSSIRCAEITGYRKNVDIAFELY